MFGGWSMALMLHAVRQSATEPQSPSAITVNFVNRVPPGAKLTLRTERLGGGRSLSHWRVELFVEGSDEIAATATVVLSNRRASDGFTQPECPEAPAPELLEDSALELTFGKQTDIRYVIGMPWLNQPTTRSLIWEREKSGRCMDAIQLCYLSDIGAPRVFYISDEPRLSATLTLALYIHASDEELIECGDDFILADMIGTRIEQCTTGSKTHLWSRSGKLLATSEQLCWFR